MSLKIITVSDGFGSETVPSITDPAVSQTLNHTITSDDVTLGYITLLVEARELNSGMLIWEGVGQVFGTDFNLTATQLNILPSLQEHLSVGDKITLFYK